MKAKSNSPASLRAETLRENRYWNYRRFKANYFPQMTLSGTFPDFSRQYQQITQPDGTIEPRLIQQNNSNITLGISQTISATGATVFMRSRVDRFDDFIRDEQRYNGLPLSIGVVQPLFQFNELKWDKKVEPLRYEESKREYVEELEEISSTATQLFFNLLLAQISLEIAQKNSANNDTIYRIAEGRYQLGKITEDELLNLELNLMNSNQEVAQSELDLETSNLQLKAYLGLPQNEEIELIVPSLIPDFDVDAEVAINQARLNRADNIAFDRRIIEAEADVVQAKSEAGLNADLFASFGLTGNGVQLGDVYSETDNSQGLRMGFQIPVIDWGRRKSTLRSAEAFRKLEQYTVDQDRINFDQEVFTQVRTFEMLRKQVDITQKADETSQKRYDIAKNRYLIGKISITDLTLALTQKDAAKRTYVLSLRNLWAAYYNLRQLTLYDFEMDIPLYIPEEE